MFKNIDLIETIKIDNGKIYNLKYHNQRFNQSRFELFSAKPIDLKNYIVDYPKKGLFRCRILYNKAIIKVEYIPYKLKIPKILKVVEANIEYGYKYANRENLDRLKRDNLIYDDIIIKKNGLLTDTTIANIAFFDGNSWITPKKPLLKGTIRAKLLDKKLLIEKDIKSEDLRHFFNFALMNAMIGFQIPKDIIIYTDTKEKICL